MASKADNKQVPHVLEPLERETLRRLHAEWVLAATRTELAKERLEREVASVTRTRGIVGTFAVDFENGVINAELKGD